MDNKKKPVLIGTIVNEETARKFKDKCLPYESTDIIKAFIDSVNNGEVKLMVGGPGGGIA